MATAFVSSAASSPSLNPPASSSSNPTSPEDNSNDPLADIRLLLQYVARAFYQVRHILLFDQLIRKEAMKDEELAARLGVGPKEVAKAANQLVRDQLVSVYVRPEVKPGAHKATQRTYYYIDYKHSVDVIKWRMWKLNKTLDDKQRNVIDGQGYVCPLCKKTYSTLDIAGLPMTATSFLCEICNTPLNDNDNDIEVQKNKDRMQRLNSQTMLIKQNLQKADKVVVPAFDIAKWVAINMPLENAVDTVDGLAVATGGAKEAAVTVQLAQEGDIEAKRRLQEQQAEAKRQANQLPVWIAQSTVNGDLTRAGIKEGALAPPPSRGGGVTFVDPSARSVPERATVKADDVDYDAYFAKLQSQPGSVTSPMLSIDPKRSPAGSSSGSLQSPAQSRDSSYGVSLKRGRADQERNSNGYGNGTYGGAHDARGPKKARTSQPVVPVAPREEEDFDDVKTIVVGGKLVQLDQVTEQMQHDMTAEEYTLYATLALG